METNDIKNIWSEGAEKNINPYSEEELCKSIVKSARKSIKAIYPGTIFRLVIIAIIVYIIATMILTNQSLEMMLLNTCAIIILSISYFIWERSAYKMRKVTNGKPIKEWLEYRIKELEKGVKFNTKYNWAIYGCSFLCAIGFYIFYQIIANVKPNILSVIVIPIGIIFYLLIIRNLLNRNYKKTLGELKDLYKQCDCL
jgi:uncharacterized membrane protein